MIVKSTGKVWEKAETGSYNAVFADYEDLGLLPNPFKPGTTQPVINLKWILDAKDKEGNYFHVNWRVTASMFPKAKLYGIVRDMIDKDPGAEYELENLIGLNNQLTIKKQISKAGKPYNKIVAFLPATAKFPAPAGFVRKKDKPVLNQGVGTATAAAAVEVDQPEDEDVPF